MMRATELMASCIVDAPDCEDTLGSMFGLPLVLVVLVLLLLVGVASALGLRDPSSRRARQRGRWRARSQEIRSEAPSITVHEAAGESDLRT